VNGSENKIPSPSTGEGQDRGDEMEVVQLYTASLILPDQGEGNKMETFAYAECSSGFVRL